MSTEAGRIKTQETFTDPPAPQKRQGEDEVSGRASFMAVWRKAIPLLSASWTAAGLALGLFIFTTVYASRSEFITRYHMIGRSPSNVLLMLRVLSELAGLMLSATI